MAFRLSAKVDLRYFLGVLFAILLTACGGGGTGDVAATDSASSGSTESGQGPAGSSSGESPAPDTSSTSPGSDNSSVATTASSTARFYFPNSVASDSAGDIYVGDFHNSNVRKITPEGKVSTIAGIIGTTIAQDGPLSSASFGSVGPIAVDKAGAIYVGDRTSIRKISIVNGVITTFVGSPNEGGFADGQGENARTHRVDGLAFDKDGNLYAADTGNRAIRKITPTGVVSTVLQGPPLGIPNSVAFDSVGNMFILDGQDIFKYSDGALTLFAGQPLDVIDNTSADGVGTDARLMAARSLTIDSNDNLYFVESSIGGPCGGSHSVVRKVTPDAIVTTIAGKPMDFCHPLASSDGTGTGADFSTPLGITSNPDGYLYVADTGNATIRRVTPMGTVTTFAGKAGEQGSSD